MPEEIKLPKGFILDSNEEEIKLPKGFVLDNPVKKKENTQPISKPSSSGVATPLPTPTQSQLSEDIRQRRLLEQKFQPIGTDISNVVKPINVPNKQDSEAVIAEREMQKGRDIRVKEMHKEAFERTARRRLQTYSQQGEKLVPNKIDNAKLKLETDKIKSEYENGDLGMVNNSKGELELVPKSGFWHNAGESLYESINTPVKSLDIHLAAVQNDNKKLIKLLNDKRNEQPEVAESTPSSILGKLGEVFGGGAKPIALASITGGTGFAAEAMWSGYANNLERLYWKGIDEGLTEEQAIERAKRPSELGAALEGATAYALTKIHPSGNGGGVFSSFANKSANQTAKEVLVNQIGNVAKNANKFGLLTAAQEIAKSGVEKLSGYDIKLKEALNRGIDAYKDGAIMDISFAILKNIGDFVNAPKAIKSAAKEYLSTLPKEVVNSKLDAMGEEGNSIKKDLDNYEQIKQQFEGIVPQDKVPTFTGWQEKINSLKEKKAELENKINPNITEVANEPLKKQIAGVDAEIKDAEATLKKYLETGKIVETDNILGGNLNEPIKEENVTAEETIPTTPRPETQGKEEIKEPTTKGDESIGVPTTDVTTEEISPAKEVVGETIQPTEEVKVEEPNVSSKVEDFDLNKIKKISGKLGEQGFTEDGTRALLTKIGIDVKGKSLEDMIGHLKNNPKDLQKLVDYTKENPIEIHKLSNGSYDIADGNHRASILYYAGIENVPSIIKEVSNNATESKPYNGALSGKSPTEQNTNEVVETPNDVEDNFKKININKDWCCFCFCFGCFFDGLFF